MTTDFRALCADLLRELDHASAWDYQQTLKDQARAALSEPEPPSDGEAAKLVAWLRKTSRAAFMDGWPNEESINLTRAAELLERLQELENNG